MKDVLTLSESPRSPIAHRQALGRPDPAGAHGDCPRGELRDVGAGRAHRRPGRRRSTRLLGVHPQRGGPGQDHHLRHALPRGGRCLRRSHRADGAARSSPTVLPPKSRRASEDERSAPRCPASSEARSKRSPVSRTPNSAARLSSSSARTRPPRTPHCARCSTSTHKLATSKCAGRASRKPSSI